MKKALSLFIVILLSVGCLAACDEGVTHLGHEYEYIPYEHGHFKQYTCGCQSPDILEEHYDRDSDLICDACGHVVSNPSCGDIKWQSSETHHWWLPEPEGEVGIDVVYGYGEHEDKDVDFFCDICGYNIYPLIPPDNFFLRDQSGYEWLNEITAEDVKEIKMISGGGGPLPPVSFTYISSSTDRSVIANIFESYYSLNSIPVSEEETQIPDGGYFVVQFMLNDGTVRKIHFINGEYYCNSNGNYFDIAVLPVFRDGTNFVNSYGFEEWDKHCRIHLMDGSLVCELPLSEFEFIKVTDDICLNDVAPTHYIEMRGEKIYFISEYYFYIGDDRSVYYQLVGKNLEELMYDYTPLPD